MNIEGVAPGAMKFTGPVLADIYLGKIKKWNEKPIADLNPGAQAAGRADHRRAPLRTARARRSSGPTTCRRSARNGSRRSAPAPRLSWPEGVGGKGNEGVAAYVQRIKGSIGYVEYAYAKRNKMAHGAGAEQGRRSSCSPTTTRSRRPRRSPTGRTRRASTRS